MEQGAINLLFYRFTESNDQEAFKRFYNMFFVTLLRFCFSLVKSKEVAEEIANDVFMHCWQKRDTLREVKNPSVYLFVVAKNRIIDYKRRMATQRQVAISEEDKVTIAFDSDPEQLMISAEMKRKLESTIQQLPPRCRMVYIMVKQYGLKYKEVATLLNLSVKTVENQLAIAMKRLTLSISFTLENQH
jgi:RNA polymerase sigma-70 factor (ECF subfamily)